MKKGLTLLEVLLSMTLLALFIFGGMSLYATSVKQMRKARSLLTAAWLAKGKLDTLSEKPTPVPEKEGRFAVPFEAYRFQVRKRPAPETGLEILSVEVRGPENSRLKLERLRGLTP